MRQAFEKQNVMGYTQGQAVLEMVSAAILHFVGEFSSQKTCHPRDVHINTAEGGSCKEEGLIGVPCGLRMTAPSARGI